MGKKPNVNLVLLSIIFAFFIAGVTFYIIHSSNIYSKCNKFELGEIMEQSNQEQLLKDYNLLLDELNNKYFEKVCDIFDSAKSQLLNNLPQLLGDRYVELNDQIKNLRDQITKMRQDFDAEPYSLELKNRLQVAKDNFVQCTDDNLKPQLKQQLNNVLQEITKRNLENFSLMASLKKQIDQKCIEAMDIIKSKEEDFKKIEKSVIDQAKLKSLELAVGYKSEVTALSNAFDVKNFSDEMPFIKRFDPEMRLMDFDKNAFLEAFYSKNQTCGKCSGKCETCHSGDADEDKNYFKSDSKDKFNN